MELLKFGKGNAKLGKNVYTFSLPAGHTCPNANECLAKADRETGKISDGKEMRFRCFAASGESLHKNVRLARWHNLDLLRKSLSKKGDSDLQKKDKIVKLITDSLPKKAEIIRIHVSGDFFNINYFAAWMEVAKENPKTTFYFYTKMASFVVKYKNYMPDNFVWTISKGGKQDNLIETYNLRFAQVVYSEDEAKKLNLEIDHDDSHAMRPGKSFALLIHGTQPKGSEAAKAKSALKGLGSYSHKKVPLTIIPSSDKI